MADVTSSGSEVPTATSVSVGGQQAQERQSRPATDHAKQDDCQHQHADADQHRPVPAERLLRRRERKDDRREAEDE
jgi:hypothetical protein